MRTFATALAALVAASLAGCSTERSAVSSPGPLPGAAPSARLVAACPMEVPGTTVTAVDTPGGSDVTFTTSDPDRVSALRNRVRALADLRNERLAGRPPSSVRQASMAPTGAWFPTRPGASWATVEDVEAGARMVVTTEDAIELFRLRDSIRGRVQRLAQGGGCVGDWMP